jgi:DNA repair protein RecO (recombination protein O)
MYVTTKGLVLRETNYGNSSKILTVLTDSEGKITVSAKGARRKGSKIAAPSQFLVYSEMTLVKSRDRWYLNDGNTIELFTGLRSDILRLSAGAYFAELLEAVSDGDAPDSDILRLGLNSLYMLSEGKQDIGLIKAVFELRIMCLSGYEPALSACEICGKPEPEGPVLDCSGGVVLCEKCVSGRNCKAMRLCTSSLAAMRYIVTTENAKLFSFTLKNEPLKRLAEAAEAFVETQLEKRFRTLDFYKKIIHN